MREVQIPLVVVKELLDAQNRHTETMIKLLGEHLEKCAVLFERALNPPVATVIPEVPDMVSNLPRMSEEEEDWYYAFQQGDITKAELDKRLKGVMQGAYSE